MNAHAWTPKVEIDPDQRAGATPVLLLGAMKSCKNTWEDGMSKHRHSPQASRRNFLKGAGLMGAAAAVTPPIAANAIPAGPPHQVPAAVCLLAPPAAEDSADAHLTE
jgi:hypothetical protein